ncbi:bifunctional diaminohydroxyphosphoribosylaminopyrimidine deaminase/5-amino-6-(5-phosphoribosylamino)uracil reductase RibD [Saccharothrix violaceirubra]|nr:bifunctional diaminohydroxyphosphoribosylaminopyrimidine deaminase/5-amino-6-(5-phosphoribosylamino)uracil reductase RibD [Saccharothrix violaceirubra]
MARAVEASAAVLGTTSPNPPVGCVVLDASGEPVGVGATRPPGGPHAEVVALREAGDRAVGGTAVVTLEPCAHHGRTPPCTDALLAAGVRRVVHAVSDPNPTAAGGADVLRAAGVEVESGFLAEVVGDGPLRAWLHFARTGRPHVTWYASDDAEKDEHIARADAIVSGMRTAPSSGTPGPYRPLRVDVGHPAHAHDVDAALAGRDVVDVVLVGGPTLAGAFAAAGRLDRVLAHLAPELLGDGRLVLSGTGVATAAGTVGPDAVGLVVERVTMSGPGLRVSAVPVR